jgi:type VI secretion system protein ImpA
VAGKEYSLNLRFTVDFGCDILECSWLFGLLLKIKVAMLYIDLVGFTMAIDIESFLSEVSAESPCGEDLSYDASFLALEDMLRTKAGGGVVAGVEEAAEEPNWREVRDKSSELLKRSKDLRVAMYLTISLLKLEGIHGLRDGLALLRGLLERFWDHLYPQLDPEDNNDPLERINILQSRIL